MTDPQNPDQVPAGAQPPAQPPAYGEQPPAYDQPPAQQPPAYGEAPPYGAPPPAAQPAYGAAPPAYGAPTATDSYPGKTMGIVAFILALAGIVIWIVPPIIGLILGIVALVQSKKAGRKNGLALAAIIISAVLIVIGIIITVVLIGFAAAAAAEYARLCAEYGTGVHEIGGVTVRLTCPS